MSTLLDTLQKFCRRQALPVPTAVMTSKDDQVIQLYALLEEILDEIVTDYDWNKVTYEVTFSSVASELQGNVFQICPRSFYKIKNETIYDRTRKLPIFGPRSSREWAALKAIPLAGPFYQYRILNDNLLVYPEMPAGHTLALEYVSSALIYTSTVENEDQRYVRAFVNDADEILLPQPLILQGLRYKWRATKGLDFAAEFASFQTMLTNAMGNDGTKPRLDMATGNPAITPGIFVPSGNWNLP